jgi:hypothetical protein
MSRPSPRRSLRSLSALAAAALLVSCGGDDVPEDRLSADAWVARADAVCEVAEREIEALPAPSLADQDSFAAYMSEVAQIGDRQLDELRQLTPPADVETDYRALLDISAKQVEVAREIAEAARHGDAGRVTRLVADSRALSDRADSILARYPFGVCGGSDT